MQRNIEVAQEQNLQIVTENDEIKEVLQIKSNRDNNLIKFSQGEQFNPSVNKQGNILDQLPISTSQIGKEILDKKQVNFDSKQNEKEGNSVNNLVKQKPFLSNISEVANVGQFSLLESELFNNPNKGKDYIMNNIMELESFNLSPIKNKSTKQEKSTICDRSCLQAILGMGEISHRGIKKNTNNSAAQNHSENLKDNHNIQEVLELKQSNFQNKVKKILDMNTIKQQELNHQDKQLEKISKEDTCPNFQEFVTNLHQINKGRCNLQNNFEDQLVEQNKLLYSVPRYSKREDDQDNLKNDISGKKPYLSNNRENQNQYNIIEQPNKDIFKCQNYQVKINKTKDPQQQMNRNKDDNYDISKQSNIKQDQLTRYSNLQIGIPCNEQQQQENNNQNHKTQSQTNINSNNKICNSTTHSKKQSSGQIIQIPHTTKEGNKKFVFDNSECSMQFKEDIDDFRRIFEGKRRSSLNLDQVHIQEHQDVQNNFIPQSLQSYNSTGNYKQQFDKNENQLKSEKLSILQLQEENNKKQIDQIKSSSSQSLGASNRGIQQQNLSSKKKSIDNNNLKLYEVNDSCTTRHLSNNDLKKSHENLIQYSQNYNNSSSRNNRMNSITEFENKNYISAQAKKFNTPNNNQQNQSSQNVSNNIIHTLSKLDQKNNDQTNEDLTKSEQSKITNSHNLPFSNSKVVSDQITSGSKKKLTALSSGNAYHLQQKHHDKYDFYYLNNNQNSLNSINNIQSTSNIKSMINHTNYEDQQNLKNFNSSNFKSGDQANRVSTVASNHSNEEVASQIKKLSSKSKKGSIIGMIVNTSSREQEQFPLQPATTSSLIRKQIASTVNEAVRNSTQHLQIIYNSNNLQNSQNNPAASNQHISSLSNQQLPTSNRLGDNPSDQYSSKKSYISSHNQEQINTQQSYHGLQNILKYHASNNAQLLNKNGQNQDLQSNRNISSNVERLREVKNRVRDLNLNKEQISYLTNTGQKENYPPSQVQINNPYQIWFKTNQQNNNEEYSSALRRSNSNKGECQLENQQQSSLARRCSQNNQLGISHNKQNGEHLSISNFQNDQKYQGDKLFSALKETTNQNINTLRNEEQSGFKRNSSCKQSTKISESLKNESSQICKSTDSTRRSKNYNFKTQY